MKNIVIGFVAAVTLLLAPLAFADNDRDNRGERHNVRLKQGVEVVINDSGRTLVRGATVTGISGSAISASLVLGSTTLGWTVNTDSSTHFVDRGGRNMGLSGIAVGDTISFNGPLGAGTGLSVNATIVKDWSKDAKILQKHTFEGTLQSVASSSAPTSFVLTIGGTSYTVNVSALTLVLKNNWTVTPLSSLTVGDKVRVYGSLQATTTSVIDALVVRDTSIK